MLETLGEKDSDIEADDAGDPYEAIAQAVLLDWDAPGSFLLQMAHNFASLAPCLHSEEVVNAVFTTAPKYGQPHEDGLLCTKHRLEEAIMRIDLLIERMHSQTFRMWVPRDSVLEKEVVHAAQALKWYMLS